MDLLQPQKRFLILTESWSSLHFMNRGLFFPSELRGSHFEITGSFICLSSSTLDLDPFTLVWREYQLSSRHAKVEGEFMLIFLHWLFSLTFTFWHGNTKDISWTLLAKYIVNFVEEMQNVENRIAVIVYFKMC